MATEYKIISDYSQEHLEQSISHYLKEGWQLAGGVNLIVYVSNPDEINPEGYDPVLYSQAIYR